MQLQISYDFTNVSQALEIAKKTAEFADILEIGTPLLLSEGKKIIEELRETPLKIKQKIVKLSGERLGIYLNSHIVRSLQLKKGEEILVSVPDKRHILLELP